ncbi:cation transporter, partial [Pilosibacter sp. HC1M1C21]|uniref:cation transporter n=1 Tax=Pilosibacter sp. HC1M1C21 TaxID=3378803 RepID=UPI00385DEAFE
MDELERTKQEPDEHEAEECCCGHHHHHDEDHCCGHEHGEHHDAHHDEHHEHEHCGCGHHHHHDGENHCCDNDDDDDCCGHEHGEHHNEHHEHEQCSCGHHHHHDGEDHCCDDDDDDDHCGHEHGEHHEGHEEHHHASTPKSECIVYVMKNIDCANCSAKIEKKIQELPEVDDCILTFATRQLRVYSSEGTKLLPKMQAIADQIEPGTIIEVRPKNPKAVCTVYVMKNIDCANCSAKIEKKIQELPEVDDCILTFATRQLRVYSSEGTKLLPKMQEIADQIEPGTVIEIREEGKPSSDTRDDKHDHDIPELLAGAALFIIGELLSHSMPPVSIGCFVI